MNRHRPRILIADDNLEMARTLAEGLSDRGYDTVAAGGGKAALEILGSEKPDAVVTDIRMPDVDGMAVLAASRRIDPQLPVIVMTAYSAIDSAVESIRQGAYHYLTKPFKLDELAIFLERALEEYRLRNEALALRKTLKQRFSTANLSGDGPARRAVSDVVQRVADADVPPRELEFRGGVLPFRELQHRYALWALGQFAGHRGRTADRLGVDGETLARWLSEDSLEQPPEEPSDAEKLA
jgi:DNA-binding NtrC family response regulator